MNDRMGLWIYLLQRNISKQLICLLGSFLLTIPFIWTQTTINSTQFLHKKLQNSSAFTTLKNGNSGFKTTFLEEVEIRTETKDFDFDRQSYTIRVTPNSKKNRQAQMQLFRQLGEDAKLERQVYLNDFIELAYEDWLNIYALQRKAGIEKKQLIVYKDIEKVLLRLGQISELKIKDLLEVQSDLTNTTISIQTIQATLDAYLDQQQPDFSDLLTIEDIRNFLLIEANQPTSLLSSTKKKALKEETIASEIALEIADQKRWLDFLQVQYQGPHTDGLQERISIGAGIKIPFSSSNRLKMEELKMEKTLLQEEFEIDQALYREKLNRKKLLLKALLGEYTLTKTSIDEHQNKATDLVNKLAQQTGTSPLLVLYNQIEHGKQSLDMLKLEVEIYQQYIEYLALTEKLFAQPFQNFLVQD